MPKPLWSPDQMAGAGDPGMVLSEPSAAGRSPRLPRDAAHWAGHTGAAAQTVDERMINLGTFGYHLCDSSTS